ncbi:exported hypothetical protein [Burkholderia sp. 8Y]|nr:exported hypothetical protein [Burkholderia sp. 8Y]
MMVWLLLLQAVSVPFDFAGLPSSAHDNNMGALAHGTDSLVKEVRASTTYSLTCAAACRLRSRG